MKQVRRRPPVRRAEFYALGAEIDRLKSGGWSYRTIGKEIKKSYESVRLMHQRWLKGQYNP